MRALTVQQPWAWAIVHGGKDVENRTQAWSYRGPLAIHAGLGYDVTAYASGAWPPNTRTAQEGKRIRGAFIGVVDLVDVHVAQLDCCTSPWGELAQETLSKTVHLELANPRPLAQRIRCRGRLGLWTPPDDIVAQLEGVTSA